MAKLALYNRRADGSMPWQFQALEPEEEANQPKIQLTLVEKRDLLSTKVWAPEDSPEAAHNWLRPGVEGTLWAGNGEGPDRLVAKVRGKGGRRLGGTRMKMPREEKRLTTSIQLTLAEREKLERLASERTALTGKRWTISMIVSDLIENA